MKGWVNSMAMVTMKKMLIDARHSGYALGAFEFWSVNSAKAIIESSKERNLPSILQIGPAETEFIGYKNVALIGKMMEYNTDLPFALHFDHATTYEQIQKALDAGFTSVMIDSSTLPYEENVEMTCKVVELACKYGATVESELGHVGGLEGEDSEEHEELQTVPEEASRFIRATGIDFLAVSIGTVHGLYQFSPKLNISRLKSIAELVDIPLVLHGGSNTPKADIQEAIRNGIAKINICTDILMAEGKQYIRTQEEPGFRYSIVGLHKPAFEAEKVVIGEKMDLFRLV